MKNVKSNAGAQVTGSLQNETSISTIVEMGFPRFRTEEAPRQAGVNNIELMMEWLFSHPRETHKDDELARSLTMSLRNSKFDTKENLRLRKFTALVDDLLAEGVLTANPKEKHNAFEIGQKHIEIVAQLEDYIVVNPTKRVTYASHTVGRYSGKRFWNPQYFNWRNSNA